MEQTQSPKQTAQTEHVKASPRRFILSFLVTFLLVLAGLFFINFAGNAAHLFPSPWRPELSERGWKTRRFDALVKSGQAPKALIMGSSRVMQIRPKYLAAITGKPAFNYGVSNGGPIDFIAQLRHVIEMHATPDRLVIGLDEQAFNNVPNVYMLQNLNAWGLYHNLPWREELSIGVEAIQSINMETTRQSFSALCRPAARAKTESIELMLDDGYLIYAQRAQDRAAGKFLLNSELDRFTHVFHRNVAQTAWDVTPRKVEIFREALALAQTHHVKVDVIMLPMHPTLMKPGVISEPMKAQRELLKKTIAPLCGQFGATWHDFTDLKSYGGDANEFWDGVHQTPENLRRMTNAIFGLPPEKVVIELPSDVELLNNLPAVNTRTTR